jgi:HSP20 family protein
MANRKNNDLISYNPFNDLDMFEKSFFSNPFDFFGGKTLSEFKTDIKDNGDSYLLEADLPGFAKDDINIDIDRDTLTINAERHSEHEEKDKRGNYIRCERSYGSYSRSFDLSNVKSDAISAKYDNGVLSLTLPKKEATLSTSRRLMIE